MIEDFIFENNLNIENVGNTYTFQSPVGKSIIDLTITNVKASQVITDWHVDESESFSDHKYIIMKFKDLIVEKVYYRNLKKTDWQITGGLKQVLVSSHASHLAPCKSCRYDPYKQQMHWQKFL